MADEEVVSTETLVRAMAAAMGLRPRPVHLPGWVLGAATNNSLGNILKGNLESYRACKKNGLDVSPLFIACKILSRIPQFFLRSPYR